MPKTIIILLIIISLICGGIAYFYFYYEMPTQLKDENKINLNIYATESSTGLNIRTGYKIFVDGNLYAEGKTLINGAVREKVLTNNSIVIYNYNLDKQDYYTSKKIVENVNKNDNRINLDLKKYGSLIISHKNILGVNFTIPVNVKSNGYINQLVFCVEESPHIIYVNSNYPSFQKIDNNKCFLTKTINNENIEIIISYEKFGTMDANDYIKLLFYDTNEIPFAENNFTKREEYIIT